MSSLSPLFIRPCFPGQIAEFSMNFRSNQVSSNFGYNHNHKKTSKPVRSHVTVRRLFHISTWTSTPCALAIIPRSPVSRSRSHCLDKGRRCFTVSSCSLFPPKHLFTSHQFKGSGTTSSWRWGRVCSFQPLDMNHRCFSGRHTNLSSDVLSGRWTKAPLNSSNGPKVSLGQPCLVSSHQYRYSIPGLDTNAMEAVYGIIRGGHQTVLNLFALSDFMDKHPGPGDSSSQEDRYSEIFNMFFRGPENVTLRKGWRACSRLWGWLIVAWPWWLNRKCCCCGEVQKE